MAKLENYLVEDKRFSFDIRNEVEIKKLGEKFKKDCSQYFGLMKTTGKIKPLYRAVDTFLAWDDVLEKDVRQNRKPSGTPKAHFKEVNEWLRSHGHLGRENSVMAISVKDTLMNFGDPFYFFPIGRFSYTWVRSIDFNLHDEATGWDGLTESNLMSLIQKYKKSGKFSTNEDIEFHTHAMGLRPIRNKVSLENNMDKKVDIVDKYLSEWFTTNKDFKEAYHKGYEIWFNCKKYYLLSRDSKLLGELHKNGAL